MSLDDGFGGFLTLALAGFLAHEPWRWLGFALGRNLTVESEAFKWVRAVSTALVAGLCLKLVFFPSGALADASTAARVSAFAVGIACYFGLRRTLFVGVSSGIATLLVARHLLGL
jgi:branched-subunit amino acid transport protein